MIQNKQLICNGRVVLPNRVEDVSLLVEDGRITALLEKGSDYSGDCEIIDASGR